MSNLNFKIYVKIKTYQRHIYIFVLWELLSKYKYNCYNKKTAQIWEN